MTVGLPGAGVGGIFYLVSALFMPLHAAIEMVLRRAGHRPSESPARWKLVWAQFATALAIIAGLWLAGWALASYLIANPTALGSLQTAAVGKRLPNVLRVGAVIVSLGTLIAVLLAVQVAQLVVRSRDRSPDLKRNSSGKERRASIAAALILGFAAATLPLDAQDSQGDLSAQIARADSAWESGDTALARREYELALAIDPTASRPLYRLGELSRGDKKAAREFFRRYTVSEPGDAWGWIALGNAYSREGRKRDALASYDRARGLAPGERDVTVGRARVLAAFSETDQAIRAYEEWIASHGDDAEGLVELGDQLRRAGRYREAARAYERAANLSPSPRIDSRRNLARSLAAPWLEASGDGSRDTDENTTMRARASASVGVGNRGRVVIAGSRRWINGPTDFGLPDFTVDEAAVGFLVRPAAAFRAELHAGLSLPRSRAAPAGFDDSPIPVGSARGTWRGPGGRPAFDLRASRALLDVSPLLVQSRVTRSELAARADVPVARGIGIRAGVRGASYESPEDESNTRLSLLGAITANPVRSLELSGVFQRLTFSHESFVGYFSPEEAQLIEAALYAERESDAGVVLAIDAGAGAARFRNFGAVAGKWEPSLRFFSSLTAPIRPGSEVRVELDSYDSRLASDAATSESWRFVSLSVALRVSLN